MQAGTSPNHLQHELYNYTIGHSCEAECAIEMGLVIRLYNVSKWDACVDNPMEIKKILLHCLKRKPPDSTHQGKNEL